MTARKGAALPQRGGGLIEVFMPQDMIEAPDPALLAALRCQLDWGADEAVAATPAPLAERVPPPVGRWLGGVAPKPAATPAPTPAAAVGAAPMGFAPAVSGAAALAAAAGSLEALRAAMAGFEGSPLRETATNLVFSDGVPGSGLMLVGEAPGAEEDREGRPFVGQSGRLLDRMLASAGLRREADFYVANILPWRPPGNRTPTDAEIALFLPFILRHIALARPKRLLLLGGTAAKALLRSKEGIMRMRGRWHALEVEGLGSLPVLPTLHPAYLLRSPGAKREAWTDLLLLRQSLDAAQHDKPA
ncbi:DNA polymerase [Humitalea rosea]|uniref:Type-4 uracil-DNA glycosylase n=2 Tax=Humitalea rosea TaxID=990373 RepID=A0A2W7IQN9_9PROT|nr:DNA polymerase [Humitalea rosea]